MNKQDKFVLERKTRLHYQFLRLKTGLYEVVYNRRKTAVVAGYLGVMLIVWIVCGHSWNGDDIFSVLHRGLFGLTFPIYVIGGFSFLLV